MQKCNHVVYDTSVRASHLRVLSALAVPTTRCVGAVDAAAGPALVSFNRAMRSNMLRLSFSLHNDTCIRAHRSERGSHCRHTDRRKSLFSLSEAARRASNTCT